MKTQRNRTTGRYTDTQFDKRCTCGHTLGQHSAERIGEGSSAEQPCFASDWSDEACACTCFTLKKEV